MSDNNSIYTYFVIHSGFESALSPSSRVKYSAVDICTQYLVLGANTGTLYFYEKDTLRFLALISNKDIREPISKIKFSNLPNILAISTAKGSIFLLELNLNNRKEKEKVIFKYIHKEELTCLEWGDDTLFFADDVGNIAAIPLTKARSLFFSPEMVYKCDSSVVQIDYLDNQLLASSLTRCIIINFTKHTSLQIGSQLRDGRFGACFSPDKKLGNYLLAARPGKRIWLADCDQAEVRKTLNFKDSLRSPTPILQESLKENIEVNLGSTIFSKLLPLTSTLLLAWESNALFLIDVQAIDILEWHVDITNIHDLAVHDNVVFIIHGENRNVSKITLQLPSQLKQMPETSPPDIPQQAPVVPPLPLQPSPSPPEPSSQPSSPPSQHVALLQTATEEESLSSGNDQSHEVSVSIFD